MPAVSTYRPTGDLYIDGLLSGTKWAVNSFTFSFPTGASFYEAGYGEGEPLSGFEALNGVQQAVTRSALKMYASVANLSFTEIAGTSTQHADFRYAMSDVPSTAWAYYPYPGPEGGDAWFNNASGWYDNPIEGSYAYHTFIHEIGHALGLKHSHEIEGSFGAMPSAHDSLEYTVMSYRSYVGASTTGDYTNDDFDYPQSLMMDDIRAIQQLYGANFNTQAGDTVYKWSPTTGEMFIDGLGQGAPGANRIFLTVWDGNGNDTYDFSNYTTNLTIDLRPGAWTTTSSAQLAHLDYYGSDTHLAAGNIANALLYNGDLSSLIENAVSGFGNDRFIGNLANNVLYYIGGRDIVDGGSGADTADFSRFGAAVWVNLGNGGVEGWTMDRPDFSSGAWREIADIAGFENLAGTAFGDMLIGDGAANLLSGAAGDDTLRGNGGDDIVDGGGGTDTVVFTGMFGSYTIRQSGADLLVSGASEGTDTVRDSVERFQFADVRMTRTEMIASLTPPTFTEGNDVVALPAAGGTFAALGGNDQLTYQGGRVTLDGGSGADAIDFSRFGAAVWINLGNGATEAWTRDAPNFNSGTWREIADLTGVENLVGTAYEDMLVGDGAANTFFYAGGRDTISGGSGADTADFSRFGSAVWVNLGNGGVEGWTMDRAGFTEGTWREIADLTSVENLVGTAQADMLIGDGAANVITGLGGADTLRGNGGADTFVFQFASDALPTARDTIQDFASGVDRIDLRGIDAVAGGADDAFTFVDAGAFSGGAGELNFVGGVLSGDINGDKVADFQVNVSGVSSLSATDFWL